MFHCIGKSYLFRGEKDEKKREKQRGGDREGKKGERDGREYKGRKKGRVKFIRGHTLEKTHLLQK